VDAIRVEQNHYNLVYPKKSRDAPALSRGGIGVIPWSPLARGFSLATVAISDRGDTKRGRATTTRTISITAMPTSRSPIAWSRLARPRRKPTQIALACCSRSPV